MPDLNFIINQFGIPNQQSYPLIPTNLPDNPTLGAVIVWECRNYEDMLLVRVTQTYDNNIPDNQIEQLTNNRCTNIGQVRELIEQYLDEAYE